MKANLDRTARGALALLAMALALMLTFPPLVNADASANTEPSEYQQFVHTFMNSTRGNYTSVAKPVFSVFFNESDIPIGGNWSINIPLVANRNYHVYLLGDWVNNGASPKTDYDVYVYDPRGALESEHTEAAGFPEHLGSRTNNTFFTPATTGNYTFVIKNDAGESKGAQPATFMVIENIETNQWYSTHIQGKRSNGLGFIDTSWAYEFVTDQARIEVYVDVPETLDMYEVRLYAMSDSKSFLVNNSPLPWEPGLHGKTSSSRADATGGYSVDSTGYRGIAYDSCEYKGQPMRLNYSTTSTAKTLYHIVFIGESGWGDVNFLIKTRFNDAALVPTNASGLSRIYAGNDTIISYFSISTNLQNAALNYTTNNWNTTRQVKMRIENRTCTATIPKQLPGTLVEYQISAEDTLMNKLSAEGNFTAKQNTMLNISLVKETVRVGDNVTITGMLKGSNGTVPITIQFMSLKETIAIKAVTNRDGTFTASLPTNSSALWAVQATFSGNNAFYACFSNQLIVEVEEQPFLAKNGMLLGGGGFVALTVVALVYYIRKQRQ